MDEKIYNDKRFLIDYASASDESYCVFWAIPVGIAKVMTGLLEQRGLWRSTYVKEYHRDYYVAPSEVEFAELADKIGNFLGGISFMNCIESLLPFLTQVGNALEAIANRPCCCGNINVNIIQGQTEGGNTLYGEQSPIAIEGEGEGTPPEGFDTWEEYFTHKCSVANFIVDSLLTSLRQLSFIELVGLTVGSIAIGAALAGVISLGPAGIPILVAALIVAGVLEGLSLLATEYLEERREEIVCGLYLSSSTQDAVDVFMEYVDEGIAVLALSSAVGVAVKTVCLLIAGTDTMNQLFNTTLAMAYPDADCSACDDEEPTWTIRYGTGEINYETSFTMTSSLVSGFYLVALSGELRECSFSDLTGYTNYVGNDFRAGTGIWGEEPSGDVWDSDTPFSGSLCCRQWSIASATAFTVDVSIGEECT